ncbi:MAG: hypothetical protein PUP91_12500 [Rhizonema sp. PD37]|nr:hypothetical protein [Rhizonema sp. PD37]
MRIPNNRNQQKVGIDADATNKNEEILGHIHAPDSEATACGFVEERLKIVAKLDEALARCLSTIRIEED